MIISFDTIVEKSWNSVRIWTTVCIYDSQIFEKNFRFQKSYNTFDVSDFSKHRNLIRSFERSKLKWILMFDIKVGVAIRLFLTQSAKLKMKWIFFPMWVERLSTNRRRYLQIRSAFCCLWQLFTFRRVFCHILRTTNCIDTV